MTAGRTAVHDGNAPSLDRAVPAWQCLAAVKRCAPVLLVLSFTALGSGLLRHAHDAAHAREDAHLAAAREEAPSKPVPLPAHHDETNCEFHALLNAPLIHDSAVPVLVLLGLFVAFLTLLAPQPVTVRLIRRIDCRGPPACAF